MEESTPKRSKGRMILLTCGAAVLVAILSHAGQMLILGHANVAWSGGAAAAVAAIIFSQIRRTED